MSRSNSNRASNRNSWHVEADNEGQAQHYAEQYAALMLQPMMSAPLRVAQPAAPPVPQHPVVFSPVCATCKAHRCPPVKAAALGHFRCLQCLHHEGRVVGVKDDTGATPLHAAVGNGHLECAMWLADRTGADLHARDGTGSMPVHHAAYHGRLPCLKWLVKETHKEAATANSSDGGTPVHFAAAKGNLECLKYLCSDECGANPNDVDDNGATPLYFAAQEGRSACVRWLIERGVSSYEQAHDGMCAVHAAAQAGQADTLQLILSTCRPPKGGVSGIRDRDGATPLHFSASKGHVACTRLLVELFGCTGNEQDAIGATVRVCVLSGVDYEGLTPRKIAMQAGHVACANFIAQALRRRERGEPEPNWFADDANTRAAGQQQQQQQRQQAQQQQHQRQQKKQPKKRKEEQQQQQQQPAAVTASSAVAPIDHDGVRGGDGDGGGQTPLPRKGRHTRTASAEEEELRDALEDLQQHMAKMAAVSLQLETMADQTRKNNTTPTPAPHHEHRPRDDDDDDDDDGGEVRASRVKAPATSTAAATAAVITTPSTVAISKHAAPPASHKASSSSSSSLSPSQAAPKAAGKRSLHIQPQHMRPRDTNSGGSGGVVNGGSLSSSLSNASRSNSNHGYANKTAATMTPQPQTTTTTTTTTATKGVHRAGSAAEADALEMLSPMHAHAVPDVNPQQLQHRLQQQTHGSATPPIVRSKRLMKAQRTAQPDAKVRALREREEQLRREILAAERAAKAARREQRQLQQLEALRKQGNVTDKRTRFNGGEDGSETDNTSGDDAGGSQGRSGSLSISKSVSRRHHR
ncbi:hypothetical protein PTSG_13093 [Salpingoeca rosetta]|uniref:Uncharacterized protein n=1 Tax=Salpingoeca rosetta (strain ATCC 50818 / BSB-021) TaxID=946362 RepID=F2UQ77_SALR5|nr:uncharacterized protein PTSG_13093 [Salpingoeca rosetta]EGD79745.1 hypothetical protein PTSG_13093 [Salpingoeca rosetta]|eukprot:XP_004988694.1 hypothetical protein PTSG_13093 [Salpingoeca rosetta]